MEDHSLYRLPKDIASDPRSALVLKMLASASHRLLPERPLRIPEADLCETLLEALLAAHRTGRLLRSLEKVQVVLTSEAHGQGLVDKRKGVMRGTRISRLLLLSNDGAERFYRRVAALLAQHGPRVVAVRLTLDAETLGGALFGKGQAARLIMIDHKEAVGAVLLALADQWAASDTGQ
jgi:hypothetical protein